MTFEWPYVLAGLALIPILLLGYLLAQRRRRAYAVRFTNLALLSAVVGRGPGVRRHIPPALYLLGLLALLISLARPVAVLAVPREQSAVMLVMDISGSMAADDLRPSRMEAAKQAARTFVSALPSHVSAGIVSFNTSTRVNAPLTRDHAAVLRAIEGLRPEGATAIGDGLAQALDHLAQQPTGTQGQQLPALVVLLSDGQSSAGIAPSEAAAQAAGAQVRVHTVGIGQRGAAPRLGGGQRAELDEATLQAIARQTGGQYFYAAETGQLEQIYGDLSSQVSWVEERTEITALIGALATVLLLAGGVLGLRWFQQFP
jgi:Ca-activated chloride channel homolog